MRGKAKQKKGNDIGGQPDITMASNQAASSAIASTADKAGRRRRRGNRKPKGGKGNKKQAVEQEQQEQQKQQEQPHQQQRQQSIKDKGDSKVALKPQAPAERNIIYLTNRAKLAAQAELLAQVVPFRFPYSSNTSGTNKTDATNT